MKKMGMVETMEFNYRKVSEKDRDLLETMYVSDVEKNQKRAEQFANDLIFRLRTIICISGDKVLGTVSWDRRGGTDDGVIELLALGVSNNHRRKGIAKELILTLINEAKRFFSKEGYKLRIIYLFMEKSNEIAQNFYKYMDFHKVTEIKGFLPQDDGVMWIKYI